ncbi:FliI/YscN family ATPase [Palleronia sp. KMU-117]|uniref:FliI/YscN family ATPase n=1 Tax=Palleronia sp. KMU-117 TaxID=3434108 RepID=UPI003D759B34
MKAAGLHNVSARIADCAPVRPVGRVVAAARGTFEVDGLAGSARLGDLVEVRLRGGRCLGGEVVGFSGDHLTVLGDGDPQGLANGDRVVLLGPCRLSPDDSWIGRMIDPTGLALEGPALLPGDAPRWLQAGPPSPSKRRGFGTRLETGLAVFNTMLPLVRGQRVGLFAGSGVGKSSLLAMLAQDVAADVVVIALVGERGREVRDFVHNVLGPAGMARSVVVAATSDRSPVIRRRCLPAAMTIAEHFRDAGAHVLLLVDSVTRFAEAHREVAFAAGESGALRGYPPSVAQAIAGLCERAGPGAPGMGDITAVLSVLVAGADMDEPVADMLRGVLEGHVVLDRAIAERGRFPPIDVLKSVSRALPKAATPEENALITRARGQLGAYARAELMIQAGLYETGTDRVIDDAIDAFPRLDAFVGERAHDGIAASFKMLREACNGNSEAPGVAAAP